MKLAIDTNRYCDFCMGVPEVVEHFAQADIIVVTHILLAELRAGFLCGTFASRNERTLIAFLNRPRIKIIFPDEDTTHHYARLFKQLRTQGTPIPTNDIWVAALVLQHDLMLYSRDEHFERLPQIPCIK